MPGLLPAPHLGTTLHSAGPGHDTHQSPLVPQATSCPRPTLGYWIEAGSWGCWAWQQVSGAQPKAWTGLHSSVGNFLATQPGAAGLLWDMLVAGGKLPSLSQQNHPCKEAGDVSAGPAGGQRVSGLPQRLFLIRSPVLKKLVIRALSIN